MNPEVLKTNWNNSQKKTKDDPLKKGSGLSIHGKSFRLILTPVIRLKERNFMKVKSLIVSVFFSLFIFLQPSHAASGQEGPYLWDKVVKEMSAPLNTLQSDGSATRIGLIARNNSTVHKAQNRLTELGYNPGIADGLPGKNTEKAVKQFQRDNNLRVTGKLDGQTIRKLNLDLNETIVYPWFRESKTGETVENAVETPSGYSRIAVPANSFKQWLRRLPLKEKDTPVRLYNGDNKQNQAAHFRIFDIDVGKKDLQHCADAIIRLKAEYLYSINRYNDIHFRFTSGQNARFTNWIKGYRPIVKGNDVRWEKTAKYSSSYASFRRYLERVFMYAGTYSLSKELRPVNIKDMEIGDVFIRGGFPGHGVIVVDMAADDTTGKKLFLLAQSYMPAQDIYILNNPTNSDLSPWYELDFAHQLETPEWVFDRDQLKRFR